MRTDYYCKECKETFSEESLPNMNKRHLRCGAVVRIVAHRRPPVQTPSK